MIQAGDYLTRDSFTYGFNIDFYKVVKVTEKQIKVTKVKGATITNARGTFHMPSDELVDDVYHEAGSIRTIKKPTAEGNSLWLDGLALEKYIAPIQEYAYGIAQ